MPESFMILKPFVDAGFSVAKLKTWTTHEGGGFTFDLLYRGRVVASVENAGQGGDTWAQWCPGKGGAALNIRERVLFNELVDSLPPVSSYGADLKVDAGWVLSTFSDYASLEKRCQKGIFARRPDGEVVRFVKMLPTYENLARVAKQHPDLVILNNNLFA